MENRSYFKKIILVTVLFGLLSFWGLNTDAWAADRLRYSCSAQVYEAFEHERLNAFTQATGIEIDLFVTSSAAAVSRLMHGYSDIASSTERLHYTHEEYGYKEIPFCIDSMAVISHPDTGVSNLTMGQLREIFKKDIVNWKEVGGKDLPITLIVPGEKTGAYLNFISMVMNRKELNYDYMAYKSTSVVNIVQLMPGSISFTGFGVVLGKKDLNILKIDNYSPEDHKNYPLTQTFSFITTGAPNGAAKAFIDFALSDKGIAIIGKRGMRPIK